MEPAKDRIKESFLQQLQNKPYDKIKVSDIIKAADVNRSTFYRHYADVIDLYRALCEETARDYISVLPPFAREGDAFRCVVAMYERARLPENLGLVRLLLGDNGSGEFALLGRRMFMEKIEAEAREAGLWDERMKTLVTFSADFMLICGYYLLHAKKIEGNPLPQVDYVFDYNTDPIDAMSQIMRTFCGGTMDVHNSLFLSTVRMFSKGDARVKPITDLLSYSGFSRTVFYRIYDDKSDYFRKLEDGLNLLVVKSVLPVMEKEDVGEYKLLLDLWDKYYLAVEQKALYIAFRDGYGFPLAAKLTNKLYRAYVESLTRKAGVVPDEETGNKLAFFTCGVVCSLVYYYATLDRDKFFYRMERLYEIRREFGI